MIRTLVHIEETKTRLGQVAWTGSHVRLDMSKMVTYLTRKEARELAEMLYEASNVPIPKTKA